MKQLEHSSDDETQLLSPTSTSKPLVAAYYPALLLLGSSTFYSGNHCFIRVATNNYGIAVLFVTFFRSLVTLLLTICSFVFCADALFVPLSRKQKWLLLLRGVLGGVAMYFFFVALANLPIAVATSLFATQSVFASILGYFFLGERLTRRDYLAVLLSLLGSIIVGMADDKSASPESSGQHSQGVIFALLAALSNASIFVVMRGMGTGVHFILSVFAMSVFSVITPVIIYLAQNGKLLESISFFQTETLNLHGSKLWVLTAVGITGFSGCICLNRGTQLMPANRAAVLRAADIPINFLMGLIFLGEFPQFPFQVLGCVVIAVSSYLAALKSTSQSEECGHVGP